MRDRNRSGREGNRRRSPSFRRVRHVFSRRRRPVTPIAGRWGSRLGNRRRQPQRRLPARTHTRRDQRQRLDRRDRDHACRSRLRLPEDPPSVDRRRTTRPRHPTAPPTQRSPTQDDHNRVALDRRSHQLMAVELRPTPPQHRPQELPPQRRTLPRHHRAHRRQTPRLARPLGTPMTPPTRSSHSTRQLRRLPGSPKYGMSVTSFT
jgi:hypothetical protein